MDLFIKITIFAAIFLSGAIFLKKRMFPANKGGHNLNPNAPKDVEDILASNSNPQQEERRKTPQELLEASWAFLEEIAEKVITKFSASAQKTVKDLGRTLFYVGVRYQHVVPEQPPVRKVIRDKGKTKQGQKLGR